MNADDDSASSSASSSTAELSPPPLQKRKAGRKKFRETRHPVYRSVRERNGGKWVCEVREPGGKTRIWLGTYPTPEMAARAHDVAAIALRGESAALNFSDSVWALPRAKSAAPDDIRCAAAEAAEMYRPGGAEPSGEYVDEEELFNMRGLLDGMAEGMLLTPPGMKKGVDWNSVEAEETHVDLSLWNID